MRSIPLGLLLPASLLCVLAGCGTTKPCAEENDDYLKAVDRPRLQYPASISASERISPMVIPPVAAETTKLDPAPRCLDQPPKYFGRTGAVADSAEMAVEAWAAAWADRKADAVVKLYSPTFQSPGEGGSAAFLDQRRQQVLNGRAPAARLEDVNVTNVGPDRKVVTFVQRFGDDRVRKELTLAREQQGWRIVSERTIEVL